VSRRLFTRRCHRCKTEFIGPKCDACLERAAAEGLQVIGGRIVDPLERWVES
jgi:hypothetical protein